MCFTDLEAYKFAIRSNDFAKAATILKSYGMTGSDEGIFAIVSYVADHGVPPEKGYGSRSYRNCLERIKTEFGVQRAGYRS